MFDFDLGKIILFGAVALLVIGPKDLPAALRFVGRHIGRLRQMKTKFQSEFTRLLDEADVESVRRDLKSIDEVARIDISRNTATAMRGRPAQPHSVGAAVPRMIDKSGEALEQTYASPEMARYLGALPESELTSPATDALAPMATGAEL